MTSQRAKAPLAVRTGRAAMGGTLLLGGTGIGIAAGVASAPSVGATGTTYTVLNAADSGTDSLRAAIDAANLNSGADTIVFAPGVAGTINLLSRLEIKDDLTITGPGASTLTVDASTATSGHRSVFYMYQVGGQLNVSISGLRMTGANSDIDGGAIASFDTNLSLDSVQIDHNRTAKRGGGIWSWNNAHSNLVSIRNSTISENYAGYWGGGIGSQARNAGSKAVVVSNSTIARNETVGQNLPSPLETFNGGAGVELRGQGSATFIDTTIAENYITDGPNSLGVGLFAANEGDLTILGCTISGNHATGATRAALFIATEGSGHEVTITDSTFSDNSAPTTGALYARTDNDVTINNSTFTRNSSTISGAGAMHIASAHSLTLNQVTISDNTAKGTSAISDGGGGISFNSIGAFTLSGTIVSGNHAEVSGAEDIALYQTEIGELTATGSMFGSVQSQITVNNAGTANIISTNPGLAPLIDNGGRTRTMALLSTSTAVNAGPMAVATFIGNEYDQRGPGFARVVGTRVDIGAFEFDGTADGEVTPKFTG